MKKLKMDKQKLIHQIFIGKVADILGMDKTTELLKEANEAFAIHDVVGQSEQYICAKEQIGQRCNEQCLGCFQFEEELNEE